VSIFHGARDLNRTMHIYIYIYMATLARKLIFTSVRTDSMITAQHFPNFTFHRILPNAIHRSTVNLPMGSIHVSVTLIGLVDIYLLSDKIDYILTVPTFSGYNVYNQILSNSNYHICYRNVDCDTGSGYFRLG
jgi:hypothetical protein